MICVDLTGRFFFFINETFFGHGSTFREWVEKKHVNIFLMCLFYCHFSFLFLCFKFLNCHIPTDPITTRNHYFILFFIWTKFFECCQQKRRSCSFANVFIFIKKRKKIINKRRVTNDPLLYFYYRTFLVKCDDDIVIVLFLDTLSPDDLTILMNWSMSF